MPDVFQYGIERLEVEKAIALSKGQLRGLLNLEAQNKVRQCQAYVNLMVEQNATVYGLTTGFGILANTRINREDAALLQYKILQSHSVGVGDAIPVDIARLMLLTKVHALAQGFSGVQLQTIERI